MEYLSFKYRNNIYAKASQVNNEIRNMCLLLGIDSPKDTVTYLYAEKFAEEVYNLSDGRIRIQIYTDAQLGTDRQMLRSILQNSNIHFIAQTTAPQAPFMPKLSVFDIPLAYMDINDLRNAIDNKEFYEEISNVYREGGYKLLGIADQLFRHMTSNKEIRSTDDFRGIRIRTIQNRNHEAFWSNLGATVIPLPVSEVYRNLELGLIDAQEKPYEVIAALNLYDVQDYVINTYHLPHLLTLITSDKFYNSLTPTEKAIMDLAAKRATVYAREKADERFEEIKNFLIDKGMTIIDLPYEVKLDLRLKSMPVYERIYQVIGDVELIKSYFGQ